MLKNFFFIYNKANQNLLNCKLFLGKSIKKMKSMKSTENEDNGGKYTFIFIYAL